MHRTVCGLVVDYRLIRRPECAIQRSILSKHRVVRRAVRRAVCRAVRRAVCRLVATLHHTTPTSRPWACAVHRAVCQVATLHHANEQTLVSCWVR